MTSDQLYYSQMTSRQKEGKHDSEINNREYRQKVIRELCPTCMRARTLSR